VLWSDYGSGVTITAMRYEIEICTIHPKTVFDRVNALLKFKGVILAIPPSEIVVYLAK
jgi:hypothetical protein